MDLINKIGKGCYTLGEIPSSYKATLTYEEQLIYLLSKLDKEIIPSLNELITKYDSIDVDYNKVIEEINKIKSDLTRLRNEIIIEVNNKLEQQYSKVIQLLNDYQTIFKNYTDNRINEVNKRIDDIEFGEIDVYDPTTGLYSNINIVIQHVYDSTRYNAITCDEFDDLELSVTEFENYNITAYNFDNNAKTILI